MINSFLLFRELHNLKSNGEVDKSKTVDEYFNMRNEELLKLKEVMDNSSKFNEGFENFLKKIETDLENYYKVEEKKQLVPKF